MKGAYRDPVDHARTTQPHAGESFIDTLWLPAEHHRVQRVERQWLAEHPDRWQRDHHAV